MLESKQNNQLMVNNSYIMMKLLIHNFSVFEHDEIWNSSMQKINETIWVLWDSIDELDQPSVESDHVLFESKWKPIKGV